MEGPDFAELFDVASSQCGHFTVRQAEEAGFSSALRAYHLRRGKFLRPAPGVYRLRWYPSGDREEVMVAWLWAGRDRAVVSHESALDLLSLGEVIPDATHLTVPRRARSLVGERPDVRIHTSMRVFRPEDLSWVNGMRVTNPTRSIADYSRAGGRPDQVEKMVAEGRARGVLGVSDVERFPATIESLVGQSTG